MLKRILVFFVVWLVASTVLAIVQLGVVGQLIAISAAIFAAWKIGAKSKENLSTPETYGSLESENDALFAEVSGIAGDQRIRGVHEYIGFDLYAKQHWVMNEDDLKKRDLIVHDGYVYDILEKAADWDDAMNGPLLSPHKVSKHRLSEISSIELTKKHEFDGRDKNKWRVFVRSGLNQKAYLREFLKRHPKISTAGDNLAMIYDNSELWVVFAFMRDGSRVKLTQTFDHNLGVKVRHQLAGHLEDSKQSNRSATETQNSDYL